MSPSDLISVIIPTYKRPHLVLRAVRSALTQTFKNIEVIVVIDGPDPKVVEVLQQVKDDRIQVVELPINVKLAGARNAGIKVAKGTWVAFLDDDDEWSPQKLEQQLTLAHQSSVQFPIIVSRFINRTSKGDLVWPRRLPSPEEPFSEYLFVRNTIFNGEGAILPSTYFVKRTLLVEFPFEHNKHEDYDWLLRVAKYPGVRIDYAESALAIWHNHISPNQKRLSEIPEWKGSLEWVRSARPNMTRRAYSAFMMTHVASPAAAQKDWSAFWPLLKESYQLGQPRMLDLMLYLGMWLVPQNFRHILRALALRKKNRQLMSSPQSF